jgi:hypothetical protein
VSAPGAPASIEISGNGGDGAGSPDGGLVVYVFADTIRLPTAVGGSGDMALVLQKPGGALTGELDLAAGEAFVGADNWHLYTIRDGTLLRYRYTARGLTAGHAPETVGPLGVTPDTVEIGANVDVAAGRVVLAAGDCAIRVVDPDGHLGGVPLDRIGCATVGALRLSPDGRRVAVEYGGPAPRLAVFDVATGTRLVDAAVPQAGLKAGGPVPDTARLAWSGRNVLVAWVQLPTGAAPHTLTPLAEALHTYTLAVPS